MRVHKKKQLQVLWLGKEECKVTWEPEENIPPSVIDEFKQGLLSFATEEVHSSGLGQTMHTLTVSHQHSNAVPSVGHTSHKRLVPENEG